MAILAEQLKNQRKSHVPQGILAVTPSDADALARPIRAFMVTVAGDVSALMEDGSLGTLPGCVPGAQYMANIVRINSTGTTATGIKGLV